MVKENTNWKKPGLFLNYFISCGLKNFNKLAKELKDQKPEIKDINNTKKVFT